MKATAQRSLGNHTNAKGETFALSWSKWKEPPEADYRMYFVVAKHKQWSEMKFTAFITKASCAAEDLADHLFHTLVLSHIKSRLDEASASGRPLYFPLLQNGWGVI